MDASKSYRSAMYAELSAALNRLAKARTKTENEVARKEYDDLMGGIIAYNKQSEKPITAQQVRSSLEARSSTVYSATKV